MKLIIDVPEEYYRSAKLMVEKGSTYPLKVSIANGIPLDDVKAEIKNMEYLACPQSEVVISDVLEIIDNISKADMRGFIHG